MIDVGFFKKINDKMISVNDISVQFGGTTLFSDVTFSINETDKIALMGKNGAGGKNDIWMIGDTSLDVEAAKNAGIKHIALMTGYGDKNELEALSDILVSDVLEAVKTIKNFN